MGFDTAYLRWVKGVIGDEIDKCIKDSDVAGLVELAQSIPKIAEAIESVSTAVSALPFAEKLLPPLPCVNVALDIVERVVHIVHRAVDEGDAGLSLLDRLLDDDRFARELRDWNAGERPIWGSRDNTANEVFQDVVDVIDQCGSYDVADKLARRLQKNGVEFDPQYITYQMWDLHRRDQMWYPYRRKSKFEILPRYIKRVEAFEREHMWRLWRHLAFCLLRTMGYVDRMAFRGVQVFIQDWGSWTKSRITADRDRIRIMNMAWIHLTCKHLN